MRRCAVCAVVLGLLLGPHPSAAIDEALYAQMLSRYTREVASVAGTEVDYAGLRAAPEWRRLIVSVERDDVTGRRTRAERIAFWINVYNILVIDILVRNEPVESIRDLGSSVFRPVWRQPAGRVGGRSVSLHEIEHEILRPMGEPRIHAAIVCAATSCPALQREPWDAARLDEQLDAAMRRWMAEPEKGLRIDHSAKAVYLSRIFDWFADDFEVGGGALEFVRPYVSRRDRAWLTNHWGEARIEYLEYDWSLNRMSVPASAE